MPRKHLYLSSDSLKIAEKFQKDNNLPYLSNAINKIIENYDKQSDSAIKSMYEFIANKIADELKNQISKEVISDLKPQLNSLKFSSNSINKDTKMLLELINGIYYKEDYGGIPGIEINPSKAYEMAKERVETKIAKEHYRKSNTID
ncbi:hypothetical protein [Terrisporobacter petrolearius]|uniref:hypothetical protein n=1 Tax=Terrisporobacter petrolearius TaxID=1460447 RepID=UPI0031CC6373